jgi:hypothetical protein
MYTTGLGRRRARCVAAFAPLLKRDRSLLCRIPLRGNRFPQFSNSTSFEVLFYISRKLGYGSACTVRSRYSLQRPSGVRDNVS